MEEQAKSLIEITNEAILDYIVKNNLTTGDRLPNEYKMAEEVNVGRSTLREAVRTLVSRNILEVRQGSGTYVSENTGIIDDPLGFTFVKDTLKLTQDLFELRYLIEARSASLAAVHGTKEQVERLEIICLDIEVDSEELSSYHIEKDIEFHKLIAEMSHNLAMEILIPIINQSVSLYTNYYTNQSTRDEMMAAHREIVNAIKNKDAIVAEDAMRTHIASNRRKLSLYQEKDN